MSGLIQYRIAIQDMHDHVHPYSATVVQPWWQLALSMHAGDRARRRGAGIRVRHDGTTQMVHAASARLATLACHVAPEAAPALAVSSTPTAEQKPVVPLLSRPLEQSDLTATAYDKTLSAADISYFKTNGFLVKKGLLDPAKLAFARSQIWDAIEGKMPFVPGCPEEHMHLATPGVLRDDPASWVGAHCNHPDHGGGLRSLGHLPWMVNLVPNDPNVRAIAEQMLGDLQPSMRTRGVYTIFPSAERKSKPLSGASLGPHNDSVCQVST